MAIDGIPLRVAKQLHQKIYSIQAKLILRGMNPPPTRKFITEKIAEKIDEEDIINEFF